MAALSSAFFRSGNAYAEGVKRRRGTHLKLCLNAYSFNSQLRAGEMSMNDVIDFCAENEIDAVDMTGYYFPGYPETPDDEVIYDLKKYAFLNGVTISGTGVRNDLALPDRKSRERDVELIKDWIEVASKLGSDVVRVFSGKEVANGFTFDESLGWMAPAFQECAAHGREHGVIVGLQHHDDFLKTAEQTIQLVETVDSPWFGVILDVGSLRRGDVYEEIETLLPYAVTWQVKEQVWIGGEPTPIDLQRLKSVIEKVGYRGFLPIEVIGSDASMAERVKRVRDFTALVKSALFR